jgi:hypothetical protein
MKQYATELYGEMLADINRCLQLDLPEEEKAECCFKISGRYWNLLQRDYKQKEFGMQRKLISSGI